ncbi:hypothetical protein DAEQUDRAFT_53408 [Daedalea quercina L-15889]|uniref:Uncharacterized protein n=1 Tax=Daedalea quercina L-15889 TaxID=1314783 RepID=A0A165L9X4_9APHY|nr:hypothetical protein DAEQUDRAFT_53408 [Daedalea quercina L-15889]
MASIDPTLDSPRLHRSQGADLLSLLRRPVQTPHAVVRRSRAHDHQPTALFIVTRGGCLQAASTAVLQPFAAVLPVRRYPRDEDDCKGSTAVRNSVSTR